MNFVTPSFEIEQEIFLRSKRIFLRAAFSTVVIVLNVI